MPLWIVPSRPLQGEIMKYSTMTALTATFVLLMAAGAVMSLSSDIDAEQSGDLTYEVEGETVKITGYTGAGISIKIPSTIDGKPVSSIDSGVFTSCTGLKELTIPVNLISNLLSSFGSTIENVQTLNVVGTDSTDDKVEGDILRMFNDLTTITIGDDVEAIGDQAFTYKQKLTSVTIGSGVTSIGDQAFEKCYMLSTITIPEQVTEIGEKAFNECTGLTSITLNDRLVSIGGSAFRNCYSLESITVPDSVTSIGSGAFYGCKALQSASFGEGVIEIAENMFNTCPSLESFTFGEKIQKIGTNAFNGCSNFKVLTIPAKLTEFVQDSFYKDTITDVTVTGTDDFQDSVANDAFKGFQNLTSLVIEDNVESIGERAFESCSAITTVKIGNGVQEIGANAFDGCTKITEIVIPDSVSTISDGAFDGCGGLKSLTIPAKLTGQVQDAFEIKSVLSALEITDTDTTNDTIADSAFAGFTGLTSVTLGEVEAIGANAFNGCKKLNEISLPESLTSIGDNAFNGCIKLNDITLPEFLTSIGDNAFDGCPLTSVTIPATVDSIGSSAFIGMQILVVVFEGDVPYGCGQSFGSMSSPVFIPYAGTMLVLGEPESAMNLEGSVAENAKVYVLAPIGSEGSGSSAETPEWIVPMISYGANSVSCNVPDNISGLTAKMEYTENGTDYQEVSGGEFSTESYKGGDYQFRMSLTYNGETYISKAISVNLVKIVTQPTDITIKSGEQAQFTIGIEGDAGLQWQFSPDGTAWIDISGANSSTYTIDSVAASNAGKYRCIVENNDDRIESSQATLSIKAVYTVTIVASEGGSVSANKTSASEGETVELTAEPADGYHFVEWTSSDVSIADNGFSMPSKNVTIEATFEKHIGSYQGDCTMDLNCAVCDGVFKAYQSHEFSDWKPNLDGTHSRICTHQGCSVSETATCDTDGVGGSCSVCGYVAPAIITQPTDLSVSEGDEATFEIAAIGTSIAYQWQVSSDGEVWDDVTGANGNILALSDVQEGGFYRCVVSSGDVTLYSDVVQLSVTASQEPTPSDPPFGPIIDDDEYVPPIVPTQSEDSGDDNTTTIVACAAAAVVAALIAAFLILDRRH